MPTATLELNEQGQGAFILKEASEKIGEMVVGVSGKEMTVYHTEIDPGQEGKGLSKILLEAMTAHARAEGLQVKPLCSYVALQFRRHPDQYKDIWQKDKAQ